MLTSLAPSPIARVDLFGNLFLIIWTISAFCFGLTLQASTTSAFTAALTKLSDRVSELYIIPRASPLTNKDIFILVFSKICLSILSNFDSISYTLVSTILNFFIFFSSSRSPEEWPIVSAVSTLSPVSIHIFIPAYLINDIVSYIYKTFRSKLWLTDTILKSIFNSCGTNKLERIFKNFIYFFQFLSSIFNLVICLLNPL